MTQTGAPRGPRGDLGEVATEGSEESGQGVEESAEPDVKAVAQCALAEAMQRVQLEATQEAAQGALAEAMEALRQEEKAKAEAMEALRRDEETKAARQQELDELAQKKEEYRLRMEKSEAEAMARQRERWASLDAACRVREVSLTPNERQKQKAEIAARVRRKNEADVANRDRGRNSALASLASASRGASSGDETVPEHTEDAEASPAASSTARSPPTTFKPTFTTKSRPTVDWSSVISDRVQQRRGSCSFPPHAAQAPVGATYRGPHITEEAGVTLAFVSELIAFLQEDPDHCLHEQYAWRLIEMGKQVLALEPTLVDIDVRGEGHLTVVGDLHGQFYDLCNLLRIN
eukprot:gene11971-14143_t